MDFEFLTQYIYDKGNLKQEIYEVTLNALRQLKFQARSLIMNMKTFSHPNPKKINFDYQERGEFSFRIRFAGDYLVFYMHTNVFQFNRDHLIMQTAYIKEDIYRSYCGMICIYNFLADSFRYNRYNDSGYLIGRVFINKENHYYIDGKREIARVYQDFSKSVFDSDTSLQIMHSAMMYAVNFDLLIPAYDQMKIITVSDIIEAMENSRFQTAKRLGFRFQADQ